MARYLHIAKELIAYQSTDFKTKLVSLFEQLYTAGTPTEAQNSEACRDIVALLYKRFGLKVNLVLATHNPPQTMPIMGNFNHVLSTVQLKGMYSNQEKALLEAINRAPKRAGTVDLKNAKLGGAYSDVVVDIWMGYSVLRQQWTPSQAAAILIHEVGHCFLAFEFMYRTHRASQFLAWMHQAKTGRQSSYTYEYVVDTCSGRMAKEGLIRDPKALEQAVVAKSDLMLATVVYSQVWKTLGNDFGSNPATASTFEALSDNFAVRLGFGPELAAGLAELITVPAGATGTMMNIFSNLIALGIIGYLGAAVGPLAAVAIVVLNVGLGGYSDIGFSQSTPYATGVRRLEQIHLGVVQALKNPKLSATEREAMLQQVRTIEKILNGSQDMVNLFDVVSNFIFSNRRNAKAAVELEADLERLATNNLFVGAAALRAAV